MFLDDPFNFVQFMRSKAVIGCQAYRVKPKSGLVAFGSHMDMWRFNVFVAEKEKAVATDS